MTTSGLSDPQRWSVGQTLFPGSQELNSANSSEHSSVSPLSSFSLTWPSPPTVTMCVCRGCKSERSVCVVDRSSIGPQLLWMACRQVTKELRPDATYIHVIFLSMHIHGRIETNKSSMHLTTSISCNLTGVQACVCLCACHMLHGLICITHSVTANQFYNLSIHKSLFIYYPLPLSAASPAWPDPLPPDTAVYGRLERIRWIKEVQRISLWNALIDRRTLLWSGLLVKLDNQDTALRVNSDLNKSLLFSKQSQKDKDALFGAIW